MRRPEDQLAEHLRTRAVPAPATLERNALALPRFRSLREVSFHRQPAAALAAARAERYAVADCEHVVDPAWRRSEGAFAGRPDTAARP